jgi:hypothetical protein
VLFDFVPSQLTYQRNYLVDYFSNLQSIEDEVADEIVEDNGEEEEEEVEEDENWVDKDDAAITEHSSYPPLSSSTPALNESADWFDRIGKDEQ